MAWTNHVGDLMIGQIEQEVFGTLHIRRIDGTVCHRAKGLYHRAATHEEVMQATSNGRGFIPVSERIYPPCPSFRIKFDDGDEVVTSMASGVTLEQAQQYYIGQSFVKSDEKTMHKGVSVEQLNT